ncbi:MAG: Mrp/NBP35 family ATP-binding protein [Acidobacteriota bacterium]|nr:Mrp/NBP35 family ATP-binding protein [Acidobacteriota bacterium]MDE3263701.1 Mrp/NBP35 family ATP-binding protein [Acidobacteriota bacterium]
MTDAIESRVRECLRTVTFPGMKRDIVSFGFVQRVAVTGGDVVVDLRVPTRDPEAATEIRRRIVDAVGSLDGVSDVQVSLEVATAPAPATARDPSLLPGVSHVVAVASGKGGVGKSTVATNLSAAMAALGLRVGLLDADIYGPSIPLMFGINRRPEIVKGKIQPFERHGVRVMSLGFLLDPDTPVIWRGPMVMKALGQLLGDVDWGRLDYLLLDLPPGTGDAALTLSQKLPLSGAVIVSTPQDVALIDARKGLAMFRKVEVPVLGMVENMSTFVCPHCGEATDVFKRGGVERTAELLDCEVLGTIPLDGALVRGSDDGLPIVVSDTDGPHAAIFRGIVAAIERRLLEVASERPTLTIV